MVAVGLAYCLDQRMAIEYRHHQIGKQCGKMPRFCQLQRLYGILCGYRPIPGIADQYLDQIQQLRAVIDNQDGVQRLGFPTFSWA